MPRNKRERKGLKEKYEEMTEERQPYLTRGQAYSLLTLPYVLPETKDTKDIEVKHKWQSLGAECVNTFSNKFITALFPIGAPFYVLDIDEFLLSEQEATAYEKNKKKLLPLYLKITMRTMTKFSSMNFRDRLVMYAKHLMISGNACLRMTSKRVKCLGLDKYVTRRDCSGTLITGIIKEEHQFVTLPSDVQKIIMQEEKGNAEHKDKITIYTCYKRVSDEEFDIIQETDEGTEIARETGIKEDKIGVVFGRLNYVDGEHYGRGYIEDYANDLFAFDFLSEYKARGAATMLDIKYLVAPGASADLEALNKSPAGAFVRGRKDEIVPLELAKYSETQLLETVANEYKERLSKAFLLIANSVRDSERTTAFEVQQLVLDLENARAGIYSNQQGELQLPIANFLLDEYDSKLLDGGFKPQINTGLEAIGKQNDIERLRMYTELMALPNGWPASLQGRLIEDVYNNFISSIVSLDTSSFFMDATQVEKRNNNDTATAAVDALGQEVATGVGKAVGENMMQG